MAKETGSKCVRVAEGIGGEPEVAEQPLQLLGRACPTLDASTERVQRWTLPVPVFNMPRRPKAEMGLGFGLKKV